MERIFSAKSNKFSAFMYWDNFSNCFLQMYGKNFISLLPLQPAFILQRKTFFKRKIAFNPFPNKPLFLPVCSTSLLKTLWEMEKLLPNSNFYFFHIHFYSFGELSAVFIKFEIVICKLLQFGIV